jgi:DNA-binding transcriptional ArsR family regulator
MTKRENWLDKLPLDVISIVVMVASVFLDGRYLTRYSYEGAIGAIFGYAFNFVADIAVNKLSNVFVRLLQGRQGKWARKLTWLLVPFWLASFYFTLVFSWREASLQQPSEPQWLHWSIAAFAPTLLTACGLAEALRAGKFISIKVDTQEEQPGELMDELGNQSPPILQGEALKEAVLVAMKHEPSLTYAELAEKLGSAPSTVGYHVRALRKAGKLNGHEPAPERQEVAT